MHKLVITTIGLLMVCFQCPDRKKAEAVHPIEKKQGLSVGAANFDAYVPGLKGKRVGLVVNNTSMVGRSHLADTLKALGVNLTKILAPEHGFRGNADPGEHVDDAFDRKLDLPIVSLYGKNRKPTPEQLSDTDILIFDIQDVGVRFFTYIGTLHYVMEACAENNKKLIVLDRPNPNGYVDGPVLRTELKSFVGMHPVPVVHGLTVGEFAQMINGEGWLKDKAKCELDIVPIANWKHDEFYSCPVRPSPNLPDDQAVKLYPSICFFEGTVISVGRGTATPFQVIGNPSLKNMPFQFTPVSIKGMMKNPPFENQVCYGLDLRSVPVERRINLQYLIDMYRAYPKKEDFFTRYFNTLAGNETLKNQIINGQTEEQIRESWKLDLDRYMKMRQKYLIYP
jgi:uncharacterized protein YbbC (DUF1343 family)